MNPAWIGMGSNLGESIANLKRSLALISELPNTEVRSLSPLYRTEPWGLEDQPPFMNAVAELRTGLDPHVLLDSLLAIETRLGRRRDGPRWGPRLVDLDILVFDDQVVDEESLQLPHPRLRERAFVLVPLNDLAPTLVIPGLGRVDLCLARLSAAERASVRPVASDQAKDWPASQPVVC
jgi:2-amino-4-hydroxy-6-hydroxymethyldihydropteridine diphosphokinase